MSFDEFYFSIQQLLVEENKLKIQKGETQTLPAHSNQAKYYLNLWVEGMPRRCYRNQLNVRLPEFAHLASEGRFLCHHRSKLANLSLTHDELP